MQRSVVKVLGVRETQRAMDELGSRALILGGRALREEGEILLGMSKGQVPVDTGVLRSTGHCTGPVIQGTRKAVVTVGYGGPAAPYAYRQHEDKTLRHKVGKAKFLEDPFNQLAPLMDARMAARLRSKRFTQVKVVTP